MQQAVTAFLTGSDNDARDLLAKRAIRAKNGLEEMIRNAFDRGNSTAFAECQYARTCAVYAFTSVNTAKHYPFAADVDEQVPALTAAAHDLQSVEEAAEALLQQAEFVLNSYKDVLTAVCTVHGLRSVRILRGDHCLAAVEDMTPANDVQSA